MADTVLIIDDDPDILRTVATTSSSWATRWGATLTGRPDSTPTTGCAPTWCCSTVGLPGWTNEVLERLRERNAAVILITGQTEVSNAVRAMQLGAENFLTKPVDLGTSAP